MYYEGTGSLIVRGCARAAVKNTYDILFQTGSRAFVKAKAFKGILEFIFIKNYILKQETSSRNGIQPFVVYKDTLNRVWMEEELLFQEEALNYAEEYWARISYEAEYNTNNNGCFPN